ncbi:MAG TPA: hypothetical protein VF613_17545 [Longimicrobium sp.]|jgi:alpha-tubulin suppressor-like RCC1 family protein
MTPHHATPRLRPLLALFAALVAAPAAAQGAGQARFASMAVGMHRTCGIDAAGGVACWGQDSDGYSRVSLLGVGEREMESCTAYEQTRRCSRVPLRVAVPAPVKAVAVGTAHTCALAADGRVFCWGENRQGSFGVPGSIVRSSGTPRLMDTRLRFTTISGWSGTTCGVATDGVAFCWGINDHGQGGSGARPCGMYPCNQTPAPVGGPVRFTRVSAGEYLTCGVARDGAAYCWGIQAGDTAEGDGRPVQMELPEPVTDVSVGSMHACALGASGRAYCWGSGDFGDVGDGTTSSGTTPMPVEGGHRFTALSAGARVSCGLTAEGALWCWGRNNWGQLGTGRADMEPHPEPVRVPGETRFRTVSVHEAVCATDGEGRAWCWGANGWGQGGTGPVDGETPCVSSRARGHCSATPRPVREVR